MKKILSDIAIPTIEAELQEELAELRTQNFYRKLRTLRPVSSTRAQWDQNEILLFCGNDYLGFAHHPQIIQAVKTTAEHYGVGAGAARLISGTTDLHMRLEEGIAHLKRKEKALVFSAGYMANLGVLSGLAGEKDLIVMDKLCHASLIDAARLSKATLRVFPHKNYEKCEDIIKTAKNYRRKILVTDTVFSMDGDLADLDALIAIKEKYAGILVVDDAHGTGVFGDEGRGAIGNEAETQKIDVITGTLSKSLGALGGFAAGSRDMIDYLINFSRPFIFATALPPLLCAAALEALNIMQVQPVFRVRLWENIERLRQGLVAAGFRIGSAASPIFPIILGDEKTALSAMEFLLRKNILAPAVRYPTVPRGKARLRVTVSAAHQDKDFDIFIEALKQMRVGLNKDLSKNGR